jgi:hypothetical protein
MDRLKTFGFEMAADAFSETHHPGQPEQWT